MPKNSGFTLTKCTFLLFFKSCSKHYYIRLGVYFTPFFGNYFTNDLGLIWGNQAIYLDHSANKKAPHI